MITKELLQKFCHPERESLGQPWTAGNFTYATDGRLIVRVPRLADVLPNPAAPQGVYKIIFDDSPHAAESLPVGGFVIPPLAGTAKCRNCGGSGQHFCDDCDSRHDCEKCNTTGRIPEQAIRVEIFGASVSHLLLNAIKDLPNCRIAASALPPEQFRALAFFFDGGEGRLMPMKTGVET